MKILNLINDLIPDNNEGRVKPKNIRDSFSELDSKIDKMSIGIKGEAGVDTIPNSDGYEKYDVFIAGTYNNFKDSNNNAIIVTDQDLYGNYVYIVVTDGVSEKILSKKPEADLSIINRSLFEKDSKLIYSHTINGDANSVELTAINDVSFRINGKLTKISGNFPSTGKVDLFIAENKIDVNGSQFNFDVVKKFSVNINNVGYNVIDISDLDIIVTTNQYLGVNTSSSAKPYYGIDNAFGVSWFQTNMVINITTHTFTFVDNACFAIGFEIINENYVHKNDFSTLKNRVLETIKVYDLPNKMGGVVDAALGNNVPAPKSGLIKQIMINSDKIGNAVFQIFERITSNASIGGQTDTFRAKKSFTIAIDKAGEGIYTLDDKIEILEGEFLLLTGGAGNVFPRYNADSGKPHLGWWQSNPGVKSENSTLPLVYQYGTIMYEYWVESELFEQKKSAITINKITAVKNPENYNSVRNLITSITDASETNQYEIYIPEGTWNEYDWKGKKHVKLFGVLNGKTIINIDPLGTMASMIAPTDINFASEAGKTLANVVQYARHIIYVQDDIWCENLTFKAKDSKYAIHIDHPGYKNAYFKNCHIIEDNCNHVIGMGINGGQEVLFDQCIIESKNAGKLGFFYHNWNNQSKGNTVTFDRCKFDNCAYGNVDELGSEHCDFLNVWNCFSTLGISGQKFNFMVDITSDGKTYWKRSDGTNEPNPINVPYCIILNTTGTQVSTITVSDSGSFNSAWTGTPQRDIENIKKHSIINI